jgi:striatin 1/3/4
MESQTDIEKVSSRHVHELREADLVFSHLDAIRAIAFHPTELCLASGSDDCTVKIWRMDVSGLASST